MSTGKEDFTMALWKEYLEKDQGRTAAKQSEGVPQSPESRRPVQEGSPKNDSIIAAGLTAEGKIQGVGHLKVGGEVQGNIQAKRVQLLQSGTLIGDLKAGSLTVAAGSRMRGKVEFGWEEEATGQAGIGDEGEAR